MADPTLWELCKRVRLLCNQRHLPSTFRPPSLSERDEAYQAAKAVLTDYLIERCGFPCTVEVVLDMRMSHGVEFRFSAVP